MNSKIILAKNIKLDKNYVNVLNYTESEMIQLCLDNLVATADNYSFLRQTGTIRVAFDYSECIEANYIAFQNPDYSNKWFFAFIDDIVYKGNKSTEIIFTIDSWSTWFDYWQTKPCFINRQHVNDDSIGLHTIPENLDVGEVIQEESEYINENYDRFENGYYIALQTAWILKDNSTGNEILDSDKGKQFDGIDVYGGTVFGTQIILFKINSIADFTNVRNYIARTNLDKHIEDIENMFIVPNAVIDSNNLTTHTAYLLDNTNVISFFTMGYSNIPITFEDEISKVQSFTNFTVKNNKCFVYPYNYLYVTNNNGNNNIYKYEDFNTENCIFQNELSLSIGVSARLVPLGYKGSVINDDEALPLGKFPTCAWSSDAFTNWLTTNAVNMTTEIFSGITKSLAGKPQELVNSGVDVLTGFYEASLLPNIKGGQPTGDVITSINRNAFVFRKMRAKNEYMKIIDDYFSRFGYAIKSLEIPNITGRRYWNYVEIGNAESIGFGTVPSKYMEEINNACRRGVTIWHNHTNVGNYNLNNDIV